MIRNFKGLIGLPVSAVDGDIGTVKSFYFDDRKWTVRYIAVETGRLANRRDVLISPLSVIETGLASRMFKVNLTRNQVDGGPEVDLNKPVSRQLEEKIAAYYNWPRYWETAQRTAGERPAGAPGTERPGVPGITVAEKVFTYQLVGSRRFIGCAVAARDGGAGSITDCTVDDGTWDIRGIVIDTGIPLTGHRVVPPRSVSAMDLAKRQVMMDMTRDEILKSAEFTG